MLSFICYPYNIHLYHWNDQSFKCKFEIRILYDYVSIHKIAPIAQIKPRSHCGRLNGLNLPFRIRILFQTGCLSLSDRKYTLLLGQSKTLSKKYPKLPIESFLVLFSGQSWRTHNRPLWTWSPFQLIIRNMRTYSSVLNQYQWPSSHWNYFSQWLQAAMDAEYHQLRRVFDIVLNHCWFVRSLSQSDRRFLYK